ncbi:hypothetical protein [Rhizobium sp. C1]|uniref:hypothetical protein n=1 Tax=Rhizobium sp. C1 TaxID=1349799 RepID=UPI001E3F1855|nr:hypothetical protein [Rhizobium sp. C1]MCD2177139.1 hypothetical protein [Rhizobium sp. C1]
MSRIVLAALIIGISSAASAQTVVGGNTGKNAPVPPSTMKDLLAQGYEIKAAVPNGAKFVIFMQKDQSAYACEFVSVTNTKCGAIN